MTASGTSLDCSLQIGTTTAEMGNSSQIRTGNPDIKSEQSSRTTHWRVDSALRIGHCLPVLVVLVVAYLRPEPDDRWDMAVKVGDDNRSALGLIELDLCALSSMTVC
jgi:hypothetical protein